MTQPTDFPTEEHKSLDLSRQFLILKGVAGLNFVVIGAGGIGSNTAYMLACLGAANIVVFDDDVVEEANIAPAFYGLSDIGKYKVEALRERILDMTGVKIMAKNTKYVGQYLENADVVIVTVDGLSKRREVWKRGQDHIEWQYWIDARMGGAICSALLVMHEPNILEYQYNVGDIDRDERNHHMPTAETNYLSAVGYFERKHLSGDDAELPCGEKATAFITKGTVQGLIGEVLYNILNHRRIPASQIRDAEQTLSLVSWAT